MLTKYNFPQLGKHVQALCVSILITAKKSHLELFGSKYMLKETLIVSVGLLGISFFIRLSTNCQPKVFVIFRISDFCKGSSLQHTVYNYKNVCDFSISLNSSLSDKIRKKGLTNLIVFCKYEHRVCWQIFFLLVMKTLKILIVR